MPKTPARLTELDPALTRISELGDEVAEMLVLAERLRAVHGGDLDDASIDAVSEITGATPEFVRVALRNAEKTQKKVRLSERIRNLFLSFNPEVRSMVQGGLIATAFAISFGFRTIGDPGGLSSVVGILLAVFGLINASLARTPRAAVLTGAITGASMVLMTAIVLAVTALFVTHNTVVIAPMILVYAVGGALLGSLSHKIMARVRGSLGLKDPAAERQELLAQLMEIQDKLHGDKKALTFLSIDMVGSTQMKMESDPLAVEYTFNEYHRYVEAIVRKHGGNIHSTAGDGVTAAFDDVQPAFLAARQIQSGLIELNTHRNRIQKPIALRIGLHTGEVWGAGDGVERVNFSSVIDVAAHLQKVCPVGGVAVSDLAARSLQGGPARVGSEEVEVQGVSGRVWRAKITLDSLPAASLPAVPKPPLQQGDRAPG
ncbi:MAG TPA: adenylate/guanylate cyclase domain-containing protein [Fimbriimonadaceae bacterium]|nr:adenylate/guanylate cyclase domain-containing protein [Fimbriimonadaceae bacterium]HRJ33778.1 adenylate/guanylate cyclase domain-containing protein [Fimbriimonadaceae bacterium]